MVARSIAWADPWFTELVGDGLCYDSRQVLHEDFHVVNQGDGYRHCCDSMKRLSDRHWT